MPGRHCWVTCVILSHRVWVLQVAASANHHICVRKQVTDDGRVLTRFEALTDEAEKLQEVAAMGGMRIEEARNMLHQLSHC